MPKFTDKNNREWSITIDVNTVKRVRAAVDVDLLRIVEEKFALLSRLASDLVLLVDVLYIICKPQADDAKISDTDFGAALAGDCISDAFKALQEAIIDFFPEARQRATMTELMQKMEQAGELIADEIAAKVSALDPSEAAKSLNSESTSLPGSPA